MPLGGGGSSSIAAADYSTNFFVAVRSFPWLLVRSAFAFDICRSRVHDFRLGIILWSDLWDLCLLHHGIIVEDIDTHCG